MVEFFARFLARADHPIIGLCTLDTLHVDLLRSMYMYDREYRNR